MAVYGYARVSTLSQNLDDQVAQLISNGVSKSNIFKEHFTGTTTKRPEFQKLISKVNKGDTITVTKLDRLARNTREALDVMDPLMDKGVIFNVLNVGVLDNRPQGKFFRTVLLAVAEMERDMIVTRTQEGKRYAKSHNPNYREGRPKRVITDRYKKIYQFSLTHSIKETALTTGVSESTVKRIRKQVREV